MRDGPDELAAQEGKSDRSGVICSRTTTHVDLDPPKYAVSHVVGIIKGKTRSTSPVCMENGNEISLAKASGSRVFRLHRGGDEAVIREYIKNNVAEDNRSEHK